MIWNDLSLFLNRFVINIQWVLKFAHEMKTNSQIEMYDLSKWPNAKMQEWCAPSVLSVVDRSTELNNVHDEQTRIALYTPCFRDVRGDRL